MKNFFLSHLFSSFGEVENSNYKLGLNCCIEKFKAHYCGANKGDLL